MSDVRLSVIIPTIGRSSLQRTLESIYSQMDCNKDEVILVSDDEALKSPVMIDVRYSKTWVRQTFAHCSRGGNWGQAERNFGMRYANGSHLMFMSDDDHYLPGAFNRIRSVAKENQNKVLIFRMWWKGLVLPRFPAIMQANVDASMFVVPNNPEKLGTWGSRYEGDFDFLTSTLALYEGPEESNVVFDNFLISQWGGK